MVSVDLGYYIFDNILFGDYREDAIFFGKDLPSAT